MKQKAIQFLAAGTLLALGLAPAQATAVTLAPPTGTTTNVLALYTGDTAVEVAGPGTVKLNPSNMHTGGTTLSGGTLVLSGDIQASGPSPVGTGAFTVSGGTLRGTGSFGGDITGTGTFTVEAPDGWAWTGDNTLGAAVTVSDGELEIAGGTTAFDGNLQLANASGEAVAYRQTGGDVTIVGNLQLAYAGGTSSEFIMTGGTLVGKKNATVFKDTGSGGCESTMSISGTASARNFSIIYVHKNVGTGSLTVNVSNGGTLGFGTTYQANSSTTSSFVMNIDGGTIANDSTSSANYFAWITNNVNGLTVGPGGATFLGGTSTACAQIMCPISAVSAESGETPKGVTFDGGNWGYYSDSIAYEGPTVLKNGAKLMLPKAGSIPTGSAVTVGGGCELRVGNTAKTVSSLALEDDAVLAFSSTLKALTVSGALTLPSRAKIALYNANTPTTTAKNTNGSYAVLKVPASYAAALRAVSWSCATATSGKSYTFSVATSGDTATLSMTIATAPSGTFAVSDDTALGGTLSVSGDITIGSGATLAAAPIYGTATGGAITINNGGTLDASGGTIRPVNESGYSFHLYLNEGGTLVARSIEGTSSLATTTPMFHFNGGTIYPVGLNTSDGNRYYLRYQPAIVGAHGLFIDMSKWVRPDGYDGWVRASIQSNINHDPDCAGVDGGITVKAAGDDKAVVYFGGSFAGSGLNGGILAEKGAIVSANATAFGGQTVALASGSRFRPYDNNTVNVENLTIGSNGASEAVRLDLPSNSVSAPGIAVSDTLSVLSPVEIAFTSGWNKETSVPSGVCTALVYQASCSVDPSLFRLPANAPTGATLAAEEVTLAGGDYAGWKALVITTTNDLPLQNGAPATISDGGDYAYGNIYVGDFGVVANNTLTVSDGTVTADTLHLAYQPGIGTSAADGVHLDVFNQTGGKVSVQTLQTHWVGKNSEDTSGRADTEINLSGGLLEVAGNVELAYNRMKSGRTSTINVSGGRLAVGGDLLLIRYSGGAFTAAGILNVTDGEVDVKGVVDLARTKNQASGTKDSGIWLRGGVLKAENVIQTTNECPYAHFYFDGGTYAPYGAAAASRTMQGLNKACVSSGGAVISTENVPAGATYTIAQALLTDPALDGAADGGLVKKGAGTLALSGANTFTGPTKVEAGTLVAANADALSGDVAVADGAVLDLGATGASIARIAASGAVAGDLTVTRAIVLGGSGSILSVDGDLALANGAAIDFAAFDETPTAFVPVAAASGLIIVPELVRARNAGDLTRSEAKVVGGVLYAKPTSAAFVMIIL